MQTGTDVVVVGGGIIGCATAAELARTGASVVLLERAQIAAGASGRNHGLIFYPQDEVTAPLYDVSAGMYRDVARLSPVDISLDPKPRSFLLVVASGEEWSAADAEADACARGGVGVEKLSAEQLYAAEPELAPGLIGGYRIEDGYRLDPAALTLAFALMAREAGAQVRTHAEVKQVLVAGGRVAGVATDEGIVRAPVVVDAAGPKAPSVVRSAGVDLPISGARGWLVLTRPMPPVASHLIESAGWHLTGGSPGPGTVTAHAFAEAEPEPDVGLLIQQNRTGHVLLGGSRVASLRDDPEGAGVPREIVRRALKLLPGLGRAPLAGVWSGVRPVSPDGRPLIGWVDGPGGLFVASGHGGQGMILGGGTARLAAALITGASPPVDPAPFTPSRFSAGAKEGGGA